MAHNITNLCLATSQVSVCLHLALMVVVVSCLLPAGVGVPVLLGKVTDHDHLLNLKIFYNGFIKIETIKVLP